MNFARRKKVLEYDDVMNQQRTVIYGQRRKVLDGEDLKGYITKMIAEVVENACNRYLVGDAPEDWDIEGLRQDFGGFIFPTFRKSIKTPFPVPISKKKFSIWQWKDMPKAKRRTPPKRCARLNA